MAFKYLIGGLVLAGSWASHAGAEPRYAWRQSPVANNEALQQRIAPPTGFVRQPVPAASFAAWLRGLPMKPPGAPVRLYTGEIKPRQDVHFAIIDIDVGRRDLQQCADAVMRLRAEWQFAMSRKGEIAFNYTGGGRVPFSRWAKGERPDEKGKRWSRRGKADDSYASFRRYMIQIFAYAGTYSLSRELKPVRSSRVDIGDVFIKGGFPGHAVLVVDAVDNPKSGERRFLLVQSYMPAQDMHVLRNPANADGSPWYSERFSWPLMTPEWSFAMGSHKRWP